MPHQHLRSNDYECLPLESGHVAAPHLNRELAWMERLFEEWFITLDELKGACEAGDVRRIRTLTDRSDHLVNAIGELQPPRLGLCEERTDGPVASGAHPAAAG
jgi:hypothetical protein